MSVYLIRLTGLWEFLFCWHLIVHIMGKRTFNFVNFNLHTVKNTLNSDRDNYFPNDNYD